MPEKNINEEISALIKQISMLGKRISIIEKLVSEKHFEIAVTEYENKIQPENGQEENQDYKGSLLEAKIGEYGLAWFGNIILLFGGIFLHLFIQSKGQALLAAIFGYVFVGSMVLLANKIQKSFTYLSSVFTVFAKLLLFYVTVSLHFISSQPFIENKYLGLGLLFIIIIYQVYQSIKLKSENHTLLALFFLIITAILSNETHILLPIITLSAAGSVYLLFRFGWSKTLVFSLLLVYFSFFIWVFGNPFINATIKIVSENQFSELYLFLIVAIFSIVFFVKQREQDMESTILSVLFLNWLGFSILLAFLTLMFFKSDYQTLFASVSIYCVLYSILLKKYSPWKYSPAIYALYGFVAISITFYGFFGFPMIFLTLSLQSLLVLSMSLLFRSKIIAVMNTVMFVCLVFIYLGFFESVNIINFSFPIVAVISARIINWQQNRLALETQGIRNIYLFVLFFTILYALKKALPGEYVTLSWSIAALVYFGMSILIHNVKYRYLAIATLGATSIYLVLVDLATIDVVYRIIAFLVLAIISIGISVYYVDKSRKKSDEPNDDMSEKQK